MTNKEEILEQIEYINDSRKKLGVIVEMFNDYSRTMKDDLFDLNMLVKAASSE